MRASAAHDPSAVVALLSDSIVLIPVSGDTLRGDSSAVAFLSSGGDATALDLRPEITDFCGDLERDVGVATTRDQHMYAYRGEWRLTSDGARLRSLELLPMRARLEGLRRECRDLALERRFDRRQWTLSLTASPLDAWRDATPSSLVEQLRRNGWNQTYGGGCYPIPTGGIGCLDKAEAGAYPTSDAGIAAGSLRGGYRGWHRLTIEGVVTKFPTVHAAGYRADVDRVVRSTVRSYSGALVGTMEWSGLRLGFGPAYRRDVWQWGDTRHNSIYGETATPNADHWASNLVGALAEAGYSRPLTSRLFVELRWQAGLFPTQTVHAFRELPEMRVRSGYQVVAVGFGVRP